MWWVNKKKNDTLWLTLINVIITNMFHLNFISSVIVGLSGHTQDCDTNRITLSTIRWWRITVYVFVAVVLYKHIHIQWLAWTYIQISERDCNTKFQCCKATFPLGCECNVANTNEVTFCGLNCIQTASTSPCKKHVQFRSPDCIYVI